MIAKEVPSLSTRLWLVVRRVEVAESLVYLCSFLNNKKTISFQKAMLLFKMKTFALSVLRRKTIHGLPATNARTGIISDAWGSQRKTHLKRRRALFALIALNVKATQSCFNDVIEYIFFMVGWGIILMCLTKCMKTPNNF